MSIESALDKFEVQDSHIDALIMSGLHEYYKGEDPTISDTAKAILTQYSNVDEHELVTHIRDIREKAWRVFQYPCIGSYNFLDFSIGNSTIYDEVVHRVKDGARLLDLGCCFGQDVRKLVFDGCPSENIVGTELERSFIDFGYALFQDKERLKASFHTGDFFTPAMIATLQEQSFDFIHSASFFHLFTWDEQVEAISQALKLLKQKPGSIIFGRQGAVDVPGLFPDLQVRSGPLYKHNEDSFKKLVNQVSNETGIKLKVETSIQGHWQKEIKGGFKIMSFIMRYME